MKVTIQNGATHGFTRRDVEAIIPLLPESWSASVQQIVLYQAKGPGVSAVFYPKAHSLGLFWPADVETVSKAEGLEALLVALSVASERGEVPERLSKSMRKEHSSKIAGPLADCLGAMARNAA